jgi:hypothetical protein
MDAKMDAKKIAALIELLGEEVARDILQQIEHTAEKAQQSGIRYKSTTAPVSEYRSPDGAHWRYDVRLKEWHPTPAAGIDPSFFEWALPRTAPRRTKQHAPHPLVSLIGDMYGWENEHDH